MERIANVMVERNVPAVMRDGVTLYSDVYHPETSGPFPVILMRSPYDKNLGENLTFAHPSWYARHGYMVVVQDTRGRYTSEGEFYPFLNEMSDGYDTVEWAAKLPGSNGKVGMYGYSYVGAIQLMAAVMKPPHLTCMCPGMTSSQYYEGWAYNGGAFALAMNLGWALALAVDTAHRRGLADLERELSDFFLGVTNWYGYLPLSDYPLLKRENIAPYFFDWIDHPRYDDYWKRWSIDLLYDRIQVPAFHFGGWYDVFRDGILKNFTSIRSRGADEKTRKSQKLLMGPWYHTLWAPQIGQMDFGTEARNEIDDIQVRWFDYWLKGVQNNIMDEPPVRLFVMGDNVWRDETEWPPPGVRYMDYYLHSKGRANSVHGDGGLSLVAPGEEYPDVYTYDPRYPNPSLGGNSCCFPDLAPMGPADQLGIELLNQILVYTSEPLAQDVTVMGPVSMTLCAASSTVDTDFTAKLVDVYPDGRAMNLTEGIIRAAYRESPEEATLLKPFEPTWFTIQLGNTCNVFKAGHRIRVEVSSSSFPHWDRNTNTGGNPAMDDYPSMQVALQQVFHDGERPSRLTLPVVD